MSLKVLKSLPENPVDFRHSIYEGTVYIVPPNAATQMLSAELRGMLSDHFSDVSDVEKIHETLDPALAFERFMALRNSVSSEAFSAPYIQRITQSLGFATGDIIYDSLRFRMAAHKGHENEKARAALSAHRDTWYANPQAQINVWIPAYDIRPSQGFNFYPDWFNQAVANTSSGFYFEKWSKSVGFGNGSTSAKPIQYPTIKENLPLNAAAGFECEAGSMVVFSAAHLHGSCTNVSGLTRFSVDFRLVHKGDHEAAIGAPNVDNDSTGDASVNYLKLEQA